MEPSAKTRALHRIRIIAGQTEALREAIEKEQYCVDLLNQSLSIQRALQSLDRLLLENHLRSHVGAQMKKKGEETRAVRELLEIFTRSQKT